MFDCAVGEPGHGKDVEDGLNSVEKYQEKKCFGFFSQKKNIHRSTQIITQQLHMLQQVLY